MVGRGYIFLIRKQSNNLILGDYLFFIYLYIVLVVDSYKKILYLHHVFVFSLLLLIKFLSFQLL